jgi:VCBS repeat-containing protein
VTTAERLPIDLDLAAMSTADLQNGLYVLGGAVVGGAIASGTALLQDRSARRREVEARRTARLEAKNDFQQRALLALQDAIPGLMHALAKIEAETSGSLEEVHLATWQFHALRSKVDNIYVLAAAQTFADALAEATDDGPSPQHVQAVVDSANDLLAVIGKVLPLL